MAAIDPKDFFNKFAKPSKGAGVGAGLMTAAAVAGYALYKSMYTSEFLRRQWLLRLHKFITQV